MDDILDLSMDAWRSATQTIWFVQACHAHHWTVLIYVASLFHCLFCFRIMHIAEVGFHEWQDDNCGTIPDKNVHSLIVGIQVW